MSEPPKNVTPISQRVRNARAARAQRESATLGELEAIINWRTANVETLTPEQFAALESELPAVDYDSLSAMDQAAFTQVVQRVNARRVREIDAASGSPLEVTVRRGIQKLAQIPAPVLLGAGVVLGWLLYSWMRDRR